MTVVSSVSSWTDPLDCLRRLDKKTATGAVVAIAVVVGTTIGAVGGGLVVMHGVTETEAAAGWWWFLAPAVVQVIFSNTSDYTYTLLTPRV